MLDGSVKLFSSVAKRVQAKFEPHSRISLIIGKLHEIMVSKKLPLSYGY